MNTNPEENPYAAPAAPAACEPRSAKAGDATKWVYLVASATAPAALLAGLGPDTLAPVTFFSCVVCILLGLWWLRDIWSSIPEDDRNYTDLGRVSPTGACLRVFRSVYWWFAVHGMLCRAINNSLERREMPTRAYPGFAYLATLPTLLMRYPYLRVGALDAVIFIGLATHALWFAYMVQCDTARRIMLLAWAADRVAREERARDRTANVVQTVPRPPGRLQMW